MVEIQVLQIWQKRRTLGLQHFRHFDKTRLNAQSSANDFLSNAHKQYFASKCNEEKGSFYPRRRKINILKPAKINKNKSSGN